MCYELEQRCSQDTVFPSADSESGCVMKQSFQKSQGHVIYTEVMLRHSSPTYDGASLDTLSHVVLSSRLVVRRVRGLFE